MYYKKRERKGVGGATADKFRAFGQFRNITKCTTYSGTSEVMQNTGGYGIVDYVELASSDYTVFLAPSTM